MEAVEKKAGMGRKCCGSSTSATCSEKVGGCSGGSCGAEETERERERERGDGQGPFDRRPGRT